MSTGYGPSPDVIGGNGASAVANPPLDEETAVQARAALAQTQGPTSRQQSSLIVQWDRILQFIGANPFDKTRISYDQMYQMRKDAVINLGLHLNYVPVLLADWYIRCKRADIACFIDGALRRIWPRLVLGMMNSLQFGHSPGVKRFTLGIPDWTYVDPTDPAGTERLAWDEGIVPAAMWDDFVFLAPEKCWPRWLPSGDFGGIRYAGNIRLPGAILVDQLTDGPAQVDIDLEHSLWVVNEQDFNFDAIWGWPRTGYAWPYFWAHEYLWALSNRFFERHADPALIGYHPDGTVEDPNNPGSTIHYGTRMLEILGSIRSGSNVAMPSDLHQSDASDRMATGLNARQWQVDQLEVKGNPQWFIDRFTDLNIGKLRAVLAPEQAVIPGESGQSSRNVASTLQENVNDVAAYLSVILDQVVNNYVIPDLVKVNFPEFGGACTKETVGFTEQDITGARQVLQLVGQQDPLAFNLDLDEVCRILGLPQLTGNALKAWQARYLSQAQQLQAVRMPPMMGNAGVLPAGNGGGLAPGLNGAQLQQGLQAGEVTMKYVADRPVISMAAEDVWDELEIVRCEELPVQVDGAAACVYEGKAYVLSRVPDEQARRFALMAGMQEEMHLAWDEPAAIAARHASHPEWDWGEVEKAAQHMRIAEAAYNAAKGPNDARMRAGRRSLETALPILEGAGVLSNHPAMVHLRAAMHGQEPDPRFQKPSGMSGRIRAAHASAAINYLTGYHGVHPKAQENIDDAVRAMGNNDSQAMASIWEARRQLPEFHPAQDHLYEAFKATKAGDHDTAMARLHEASRHTGAGVTADLSAPGKR